MQLGVRTRQGQRGWREREKGIGRCFHLVPCGEHHLSVVLMGEPIGIRPLVPVVRNHLLVDEVLDVLGAEVETAAGDIPRRLAALRYCVEQLSTKGRELLSQCYASGMQLNKVAEQMGRSVGSLYTAASRLRRQVHDCVEQRLREEDRA